MIEVKNSLFLGLIIFFLSTVLFTSCDDNSTSSAFTGVRVIDNSFSPTVVRIHEGGNVRFKNWGNNPHNVIATDESWGSYDEIDKNSYIDVTYQNEGLYKYLLFHVKRKINLQIPMNTQKNTKDS